MGECCSPEGWRREGRGEVRNTMMKKNRTKPRKEIYLKSLSYVFGPWHPPLVQFPIVSSILAASALWMGNTYGMDWSSRASGVLWIMAFVSGLLSLLTGHLFAHRLGRYSQWSLLPPTSTGRLHFHALLGTIGFCLSVSTLSGALHLVQGNPVHGYSLFFLGIAQAVFFAWGAHEGGEMTFKMEMVPLSAPAAPSAAQARSKRMHGKISGVFKKRKGAASSRGS